MRLYFLILIFIALRCSAQSETVFKVSKPLPAKSDTAIKNTSSPDYSATNYQPAIQDSFMVELLAMNTSLAELSEIFQLPPEQSVISCELLYDTAGKQGKIVWSANDRASWVPMQQIIETKPKGKFTFANIYVSKGRKKIKLPDKTIVVK